MNRDRILAHLAALVACDSQNPPREISADSPIFDTIGGVLGDDFDISLTDHGAGHVTLLARRGGPEVVFNCHLDTVPAGEGWSVPPLELTVVDGRAYGRGACDIKGAAAALLHLAETTDAPLALLFTSDEEGAGGCCVAEFLKTPAAGDFRQAVVCEPTGCRAVLAHRGFLSVKGRFRGQAGHSSEPRALADSATHRLARWITATADFCAAERDAGREACFNAGLVSGGTKSNVIAGQARIHYSARLGPGQDNQAFFDAVKDLAGAGEWADWEIPFAGPPLPAGGRSGDGARAFAAARGLEIAPAVDFWTEASLFSAAGMDALVLGPGDIAQAHTADEWVALDQLDRAYGLYRRVVTGDE